MKNSLFSVSISCALAIVATSIAEEGGSAHYLPGTAASFIDAFPGKPGGLAVLNYFTYYDASAPVNRQLPLGGFLTAGIDATVYADTLAAVYQTPWQVLDGGLAFGLAVPYVWMEVEGQAQRVGPDGLPEPVLTARDRWAKPNSWLSSNGCPNWTWTSASRATSSGSNWDSCSNPSDLRRLITDSLPLQ